MTRFVQVLAVLALLRPCEPIGVCVAEGPGSSVDLLCDVNSGRQVVIENQLEKTNRPPRLPISWVDR